MPRINLWICDGCDKEYRTGYDDVVPDSFKLTRVTMGTWGVDLLLCKDCHNKLLSMIDPREWERRSEKEMIP